MSGKRARFRILQWTHDLALSIFQELPKMTMVEWLERWCVIPPGMRLPGPWRLHFFPPARRFFEAFADKDVHFITIMKSARTGGTLACIQALLWKIKNRPGPILWVAPTSRACSGFSQRELQPFIRACEPLEEIRYTDKERWTRLEMFFRNGVCLGGVGSNSPTPLAGRDAEVVVIDEEDKTMDNPGAEAPASDLAEGRTMSYIHTRKVIRNSTPSSYYKRTWKNFLQGTQEHIYVPCPHCTDRATKAAGGKETLAGFQRLTFEPDDRIGEDGKPEVGPKGRLKTGRIIFSHLREEDGTFDLGRVEREAGYQCQHEECQAEEHQGIIPQTKLNWMLKRWQTRAHNPNAPKDRVSLHWTTLYSKFSTWGWIAKEFLLRKDTPGGLHHFYNSILGLPFRYSKLTLDEKSVLALIDATPRIYARGQMPLKPRVVMMTVDVQGDTKGFWWTIWMWDENWNMWLIDWGDAFTWGDLDLILEKRWKVSDGKKSKEEFQIQQVIIDANYRTTEVKNWAASKQTGFVFPAFGREYSTAKGLAGRPAEEIEIDGYPFLTGIMFIDGVWKEELYYTKMTAREGRGLYLPQLEKKPGDGTGVDQILIKQITDERATDKGWEDSKNNHLGDCFKEALIGDYFIYQRVKILEGNQEYQEIQEEDEKENKEQAG
jgi:phage terminase large subunit GpA-like protein